MSHFYFLLYPQRAKEIYFKEWDPQRQSAPDSRLVLTSNLLIGLMYFKIIATFFVANLI